MMNDLAIREERDVIGDVDVGVGLFGPDFSCDQLFDSARTTAHLDVQNALVAIHREHQQLFARSTPFYPGDVFRLGVHHRACFFAFDIKYL